jgi:uncharacterized membrane protein YedE/YeeE
VKEFFLSQPPPYVAGALLGLCVVAMYAAINQRLGVVGAISDVVERPLRFGWKGSFLLGLLGGAVLFTLVSGRGRIEGGYGWLTREFSDVTTVALLLAAGVAIGVGTKIAGGCTSGNGLSGNAIGSRASLVATAAFFGTAVAVSLLTKVLFGANV